MFVIRAYTTVGLAFIFSSLGLKGQDTLENRIAELERKLTESQRNTQQLADQLVDLKNRASSDPLHSLRLTGYLSTSFRWTPTSNVGNDLYALSGGSARRDRFALDVISLSLSSVPERNDWGAGFLVQGWLGPDADLLETADSTDTEFAIKQAYINLHMPIGSGIGFKAGVFDKVIGYESTDRNQNPFHSHSWGYTIEPRQHTGFLFDYGLTENLLVSFGVANTTSSKINGLSDNDNRFTLIGAIDYLIPDSIWVVGGSALTLGTVRGRPWDRGLEGNPVVQEEYYYLGIKDIKTPIEKLTAGTAWNIRVNNGAGKNDDQVVGAYLNYEATDLMEFNLRGERFQAGTGMGASMSDGWSTTLGGTYKLWNNTKARFEFRLDDTEQTVNGKTKNKALIWNLIYSF